jgi:hypothetical protein
MQDIKVIDPGQGPEDIYQFPEFMNVVVLVEKALMLGKSPGKIISEINRPIVEKYLVHISCNNLQRQKYKTYPRKGWVCYAHPGQDTAASPLFQRDAAVIYYGVLLLPLYMQVRSVFPPV